jgi:hypothetical protein
MEVLEKFFDELLPWRKRSPTMEMKWNQGPGRSICFLAAVARKYPPQLKNQLATRQKAACIET